MVHLFQILYIYVFYYCPATGIQNDDEASVSIIFAGRALLLKMLITLGPHGTCIFGSNFVYLCILTLSSNWNAKSDKASPSIIFAGGAILVKMLITLERHSIFGSNFLYLYILTLSSHWYAKQASLSIIWLVKLF